VGASIWSIVQRHPHDGNSFVRPYSVDRRRRNPLATNSPIAPATRVPSGGLQGWLVCTGGSVLLSCFVNLSKVLRRLSRPKTCPKKSRHRDRLRRALIRSVGKVRLVQSAVPLRPVLLSRSAISSTTVKARRESCDAMLVGTFTSLHVRLAIRSATVIPLIMGRTHITCRQHRRRITGPLRHRRGVGT
jgi:hypothetical protein